MSYGLHARGAEGGDHEVERARLAQLDIGPAGAATAVLAPPHVQAVLRLQRTAGNTAVTRLLRGVARPTVQRQDEYEDVGQVWGTDEEAGGGEYSSGGDNGGGYGGGETYGPPPPPPESGDEGSNGSDGGSGEGSQWSGGGAGAGGGGSSDGGSGGGGNGGGGESEDEGGSSWWPFDGGGGGESDEGGSSWWPFDGDEEGSGGEGEDGGHSADDIQRKLDEGETDSLTDEYVPQGGSGYPFARAAARGERASAEGHGGFHDDGQVGTVPFGDGATDATDQDADDRMHPRAYTGGGSTGTVTWAGGGGAGRGPKGNQATGSIQTEVVPTYDSKWGGILTNASAWVRAGTGVADVHRDYVTAAAGDQGNGWWVSQLAASALTAHEQRHVSASRSVYDTTIQPMLDRAGKSASYGNEITYWQSEALILLKRYVGWADALKRFKDDDAAYNANFGQVDSEDFGSAHYPRNMKGPRKIGGKDYDNYLIMGSEPDPT